MKFLSTLFLLIAFTVTSLAQDITGQWNGVLKVQGIQLRLVFHITKTDDGYSSTMDSPDQGASGIPVSTTTFEEPVLKLAIPNAGIEYEGEFNEEKFVGTFKQRGASFPLELIREEIEKEVPVRPQNPKEPFPYKVEDVSFKNLGAQITLAGTLTLPQSDGPYPAVVMISGSGPQNRDEELLGHKPFLVIADHLTRNGIAVLRFDDRGVNKSEGDFQSATSADFATDVESAVSYLKTRSEIDSKKIGLVGHSEGGLIAPIVAARNKDVGYIVLMAGPGLRGDQILLLQQALIAKAGGSDSESIEESQKTNRQVFDIVLKSNDTESLKSQLQEFIKKALSESENHVVPEGITEDQFVSQQVTILTSPWMQYFIKYDPAPTLERVKCPVLAINGENDLQVPPKENLAAIEKSLKNAKNKNFVTIELEGLNHLFQESKTGSPSEYAEIEETFSPKALKAILDWIKLQVD